MGNGASVNVHPPHINDEQFKKILGSKAARVELFQSIQAYKCDDHLVFREILSLNKLVSYFSDSNRTLYPEFKINVAVLTAAFNFCVKKKKHHELLTLREFHHFIPTLFLFYKFWDIFDAADNSVIDDDKVFKSEFVKVKSRMQTIAGVDVMGDISDEEWNAEFVKLDKNKDGYISFEEFCRYSVNHICKPFDYAEEFQLYDDIEPAAAEPLILEGEGDSVKSVAVDTKPNVQPHIVGADVPVRSGLQFNSGASAADGAPSAAAPSSAVAVSPIDEAPAKEDGIAAPPAE